MSPNTLTDKHFTPSIERPPRAVLSHLVDTTVARLNKDDVSAATDFVVGLKTMRQSVRRAEWGAMINDVIAPSPIRAKFHEDPFTRRAFEKPRGYPGDAPLLDLIYGDNPPAETLTPFGERLHRWAGAQPACRSVQERRRILANLIDKIATEHRMPRILSLACGHLREAQTSEAVRHGGVEELIGLDQDKESLALVEREQHAHRVVPKHMTVRRFLVAPTSLGAFDLVYSASLYDYLDDRVAAAVTKALFAAVKPGGTLLVANFAPELRDIGYMEAIMDWNLIYRTEAQVARFVSLIPQETIARTTLTRDSGGNVIYLTLRKSEV